jgi:hypothetical protein
MVRWGQRPYAPPNPIDGAVSVVAPIEGPLDDGAGRTSCRSRVALGSVPQAAAIILLATSSLAIHGSLADL